MKLRQELPIKYDTASKFTPWIVSLLVYLATLAVFLGYFIFNISQTWDKNLTSQLTIELPFTSKTNRTLTQERIFSILNRTEGVINARALPEEETKNILLNWAGVSFASQEFELPLLIDVQIKNNAYLDISRLQKLMHTISPEITITDHREWQQQVKNLVKVFLTITLCIALLILSATLAITIFATKTSLLIHKNIIEILHLIGATNEYIAKQFQRNSLKQGLVAGLLGTLMMIFTCAVIYLSLSNLELPIRIDSSVYISLFVIVLISPLLTGLLMMFATRMAVLKELR